MTPKTLEEFIFNEVCRLSTNELASHVSPTVFEAGTIASKATAAEILRVAEEKAFYYQGPEGDPYKVIRLEDLKSHINSTNTEGGE